MVWHQLGLINSADPLDVNIEALSLASDWLNAHPNISGNAGWEGLQMHLKMVFPDQVSDLN